MAYRKIGLGTTAGTATIAAGASGAVYGIGDLSGCTIALTGTFTGTYTISLSHDGGTTWAVYATGSTTTGVMIPTQTLGTERLPRASNVKVALSAGSGTLKANLGGTDENAVG